MNGTYPQGEYPADRVKEIFEKAKGGAKTRKNFKTRWNGIN
ncbi:hypothetical protein [uncultured Ilyobacter sp.]